MYATKHSTSRARSQRWLNFHLKDASNIRRREKRVQGCQHRIMKKKYQLRNRTPYVKNNNSTRCVFMRPVPLLPPSLLLQILLLPLLLLLLQADCTLFILLRTHCTPNLESDEHTKVYNWQSRWCDFSFPISAANVRGMYIYCKL